MSEKKNYLSKFIIDIATALVTAFRIIPNLILLIEIEASEAGKSLVSLIILYLIAGVLMTSTWICILSMIFVHLISLQVSWLLSLLIIAIINISLLVITALIIMKTKKNLSFKRTRRLLRDIK